MRFNSLMISFFPKFKMPYKNSDFPWGEEEILKAVATDS